MGRHTDKYSQWVYERLTEIDKIAKGNGVKFLKLFEEKIVSPVIKAPGLLQKK
jgi:hypothetical protein